MVLGENGVFVIDLSSTTLGLGDNDSFVVANGLIDVLQRVKLWKLWT